MSSIAATVEAFFTDRLVHQRCASPRTISAYRDTLRLLFLFAHQRSGKTPERLDFTDIDASQIAAFLTHLEHDRSNSVSTRNARLTAIRSLYRYAALRHPEHAELIQRVLAIPSKRTRTTIVAFLTRPEIDALLAAPDRSDWIGRRDHALLLLAIQTGLRVSELTGLTINDVHLGTGAHVRCHGKGRKDRVTPLTTHTVAVMREWTREQADRPPATPFFPNNRGGRLSTDAIAWLLAKHTATAAAHCPTLSTKNVTPHVLRHSSAMNLLHAGVDITVIALWLGHESTQTTQIYLHADLELKQRALDRTTPPDTPPGRYRPPDKLLTFLKNL